MRVMFDEQRLSALITDQPPDALVRPGRRNPTASAPLNPDSSSVLAPVLPRV